MKIALIGSAPSSIRLAPYSDPSWKIWGCSPGAYPVVPRSDAWFELHRWEPPVIGKAEQQVPWFSPEYVMWLSQHPCVWMLEKQPQIVNSRRLPAESLVAKYGAYFFTSSLAWMFALAIEEILNERESQKDMYAGSPPDEIGLWGVDMTATEEYGYQRAGCQFFAQLAEELDIKVVVPPESDLLLPPPLYGVSENDPMMIKLTMRKRELLGRMESEKQQVEAHKHNVSFLQGAIDDLDYMMGTWIQLDSGGTRFKKIFGDKSAMTMAHLHSAEDNIPKSSLLKQIDELNLRDPSIPWAV